MDEINYGVGVGESELVKGYMDGRVVSAKCTKISTTNGKPSDWWTVNLLIGNELLQNITISGKCHPEELDIFNTTYSFGIDIKQEVDKRGNVKNFIKIVYVIDAEED